MHAPNTHTLHPIHDIPDERAPVSLPVEPDQGPVPAAIPDDSEHERTIDPGS